MKFCWANKREIFWVPKQNYFLLIFCCFFKDVDFQIIRALPAHKGAIYGIQAIDAQHFVSISRDKSIKVWDNMTQKVIQKVEAKNHGHRHSVNAVWTDQRGTIATVGDDQLLRVFRWMSQM